MRLGDLDALANKFNGRDFLSGNLRRIVEAEPTVDAAPVVHGRWIDKTNPSRAIVEQRVDCSACGHIFWHTSALSYSYCPNCGATMDGKSCVPRDGGE